MNKTILPDKRELIIAKGSHKGTSFVTIGIFRQVNDRNYLVATVGPKISWSLVTKWDYLSDVAQAYDIWGPVDTPDPLGGVTYPCQNARTTA